MIPSGRLDHNAPTARTRHAPRLTSVRRADLDARRRTAELTVDAFVEVCRTRSVVQDEAGWRELDHTARDAIDALSALLGAIDLARDEAAVNRLPSPRSAP